MLRTACGSCDAGHCTPCVPARVQVWYYHVVYAAVVAAVVLLTPEAYQDVVFSQPGVAVVGFLYPVLESVRAVITEEEDDDTRWLQYWVAAGACAPLTLSNPNPKLQ